MARPAYASMAYAATLAHVGRAIDLPEWGSAALLRDIPGAPGRLDAMGPYPLCRLAADADIGGGLRALRDAGAVSAVLVADPVAGPDAAALARYFPLCRRFKTHYLVDRRVGPAAPSKHHRDRIRRGQRHTAVRAVTLRDPAWRGHWATLYASLITRKGITGVQAFPPAAFDQLASLPGDQLTSFAAEAPDGAILAMQLWVRHGSIAYSHLTATSEAGYRVGATYAVYAAALDHFAECDVLDLGGGAGVADDPADTLASFKRGFANATAATHLCGAVLDAPAYAALSGLRAADFFPAYRGPAAVQQAA